MRRTRFFMIRGKEKEPTMGAPGENRPVTNPLAQVHGGTERDTLFRSGRGLRAAQVGVGQRQRTEVERGRWRWWREGGGVPAPRAPKKRAARSRHSASTRTGAQPPGHVRALGLSQLCSVTRTDASTCLRTHSDALIYAGRPWHYQP